MQNKSNWSIIFFFICEKVEEVHKLLGVPKNLIYPVRNYSIEAECETEMDVLILRVAKQILLHSEDFIEESQ